MDRDLIVRSWDGWLGDVTGVAESDANGRYLADLFPDVETRGFIARLRRVVESGAVEVLAPAFHQYLIPCPPRTPSVHFNRMQQHVTMSPLREREEIVGAVITLQDVTARLDRQKELAAQLWSADEAVRLRAAQTLAEQDGRAVLLSGALGDPSWRVRRVAATGLAHTSERDAVDVLISAVRERHRDPGMLNAALTGLIRSRQDVVPAVIELLGDGDADVRTYAALGLGHLDDPRAVPPLIDALSDADANVQYHAIEALGRLSAPEAIPLLTDIVDGRDFFLAFTALDALAEIGDASVAPQLVPLLDDDLLQGAAAEALGRLGAEDAVPAIAGRLNRPGAEAETLAGALVEMSRRLEAIYGAGELVADAARAVVEVSGVQALTEAITHASDQQLEALVVVLGWLPFDGIERLLAPLLDHPVVRGSTADALVRHGGVSVPALVEALDAEDQETRKAAARALGQIGSAEAVPALCAQLDGDTDTAIVAAGALAVIGDRGAFEPLLVHFDHPEPAVRQAVISAVHSIGHPDTRVQVSRMLQHSSPRVRESAVKVAGYFGYPECLDTLLALCRDEDQSVRRAAVEHVAYYDDLRAIAALEWTMAQDVPPVRAAAARGLAQQNNPAGLGLLRRALADPDLWVRYHAARAAARQPDPSLVEALTRLAAEDPVPPVRIAATETLGSMRTSDAAPTLCRLTRSDEPEIAQAAVEALGRVSGEGVVAALTQALEAESLPLRLTALRALGRQRAGAAVPHIRELAAGALDAPIHEAALDALGRIGGSEAIDALIEVCGDRRVSNAAVAALARVEPEHVDAVARGLSHRDAQVRRRVVDALSRRRDGRAASLLAVALEDEAPAVRVAAAQALGRLDMRAVESKLQWAASADDDRAVREAAHSALTR